MVCLRLVSIARLCHAVNLIDCKKLKRQGLGGGYNGFGIEKEVGETRFKENWVNKCVSLLWDCARGSGKVL